MAEYTQIGIRYEMFVQSNHEIFSRCEIYFQPWGQYMHIFIRVKLNFISLPKCYSDLDRNPAKRGSRFLIC